MADQQPPAGIPDTAQDPKGLNQPGSQSSSGMSDRIDDSLLEAHQREKQRRGEPLDVPTGALSDNVANPDGSGSTSAQQRNATDSPVNRNPEATDGPVVD